MERRKAYAFTVGWLLCNWFNLLVSYTEHLEAFFRYFGNLFFVHRFLRFPFFGRSNLRCRL